MKYFVSLIVVTCCLISTNLLAQDSLAKHPILTKKFFISTGVFLPSKNIKIKANGSTPNEEIDFGKTFDFNDSEITFAASVKWRFAKNWNLGMEYYSIKNGATRSIEQDIEWNDYTFKAGLSVGAGFDLDLYRVFFGRNISTGPKHELGGGIGIHAMDITTYLEGEAFLDDLNTGFRRESITALAPLPNIGFWYFWAPSEKFLVTARLDWLSVKISNIKGSLLNLAPGIQYQLFKNIGVGASYRYFNLNVDIEDNNWDGGVALSFHGPMFSLTGNF
ncbi:hypothetical protein [Urechidicola vernalis]|uniref:Outer membrane protein beta-barrel domain-containing protein n=1 Tax=Urechidicola vernalis TaxID=3075600 RepID=A0ABU2Y0T0_9FLAO|nr:hypothetical protein [Urechidicola sp. P050]MDT0551782.1 hypothetical protein [Urechidicola sp. P050]